MIISSSDDSDELDSSQIFFEDGAEVAPLGPSLDSSLSESSEDSGFARFWPVFRTGSLFLSSELKT